MGTSKLATESIADGRRSRRKQYVVNAVFQWKYAVTVTLAVFLVTMIVSTFVCYAFHQQARTRMINPGSDAGEATSVILLGSLAFAIVTAAGMGVWFIFFSHRICGPLHLITRYLNQLRDGRFPEELRPLRKKDEFKEFYSVFSETVESLRRRNCRQFADLSDAIETATAAKILDGDSVPAAMDSLTAQLQELRDEVAVALGDKDLLTKRRSTNDPELSSYQLVTNSA